MNIYLISQDENRDYDTYDSAVVIAENEASARMIHPGGNKDWNGTREDDLPLSWVDAASVFVKLIGKATIASPKGVICSSYNAG